MSRTSTLPLDIVEELHCDVLVCGAGCAGSAAALASARAGADTIVVEANGYAGGYITAVLGATFDGMFDSRTGELAVGGIALDVLEELNDVRARDGDRFVSSADVVDRGASPDHKEPPSGLDTTRVRLDPERFKLIIDRQLQTTGVRTLYHTPVVAVVARDTWIDGLVVATKAGLTLVRARAVVDCTGDADIAAWAGFPMLPATDKQPMSIHFRVGGIDVTDTLREDCARALADLHDAGDLPLYGGPWLAQYGPSDVVYNAVRTPVDKIEDNGWTVAEIKGRADAWTMFEAFRRQIPEFANAYMIATGPEAGARETRRIEGEYVLTGDDVRQTRSFEDAIVRGAWWLDRHPSDRAGYHRHEVVAPYDIPFRTLIPRGSENLLVAGRCHSANQEANASTRVTVTAMGMGEAAGAAAAMMVARDTPPRGLDVVELREHLIARRAVL